MEIMQVKIGKKELKIMKEVSEILHSSSSEVLRMAMEEGVKSLRMKIALEKYVNEEFSLCRAAEFAEVSIQQMARYLTDRGIAYFRQSIEESKRDVKEAEGWLKNAHTC
jgi:predicted HTH domain antitoxin